MFKYPRNPLSSIRFRLQTGFWPSQLGHLDPYQQCELQERLGYRARERQLAKIRFNKRQAFIHRGSVTCMLVLPVFAALAYTLLITYSITHPEAAIAQTTSTTATASNDTAGRCAILNGKQVCDGYTFDRTHGYDSIPMKPTPPPAPSAKRSPATHTTFTLTVYGCKPNEKGHVSCKINGEDGSTHWMYVPVLSPHQLD